ncbi:MAG: hypothetical protein COV47_05995 [Candidatus Diapherotrites archaeon CG11_big_fil_rev_8_21_14_0_20_37_9]|nr:MAG: hypothetical protein COV47_05995 [Candidatus Diapherotrites archaeon CG11_big_fil_rev_8_21_14_0_20_37_9]
MFWPTKMCKARLFGLKSNLRKTVDSLEKYGGVEIKEISAKETSNAGQLEDYDNTVEKLLKVEALISNMTKSDTGKKIFVAELKQTLSQAKLKQIEEKIETVQGKMDEASNKMEILKEDYTKISMFSKFNMDFSELASGSVEVIAGIAPTEKKKYFETYLKKSALSYTERTTHNGKTVYLAMFEKGKDYSGIFREGFDRLNIPNIKDKPTAQMQKIEKEIKALEKDKETNAKELEKISKENYPALIALSEHLKIESEKGSTPEKFVGTGHSFMLEAYLPEKNFSAFEKHVKADFGKKIYLKKISSETLEKSHEETPTLLEHSIIVKPFEFMTKFVSIPKSNELDTTLIFLVFFPIFYGMIVGDFVYGIISFLIAKFILSKVDKDNLLNPVAQIWMWSAIPTIIFGLIFDEFAGLSNEHLFEIIGIHGFYLYHGLERLHYIELLLPVTIIMGIVTMAIGFLLGFMNAMRHGNTKHAIAKLGWFGIVAFGTIVVSTMMFQVFPEEFLLPAGILMVISIIPVIIVEGMIGLIEIPSVLGNILSFARILAVGLVGVVIAMILNDLAFPSLDKGLLVILLLPLYVGGHVFNAFLAMFEALIQGARLNFVEFYSKFHEGGGKEFAPFKFERKFSRE